jgi:23S rRNA (adenine2030-N6)-methyltransferase
MANRHYGEIGDIWKHLPLAEILSVEKPQRYWESHAGSATYPLTHSWERDYGIFYFRDQAARSQSLTESVYFKLLKKWEPADGVLFHPGSPFIAMDVLQENGAEFLFCDLDSGSVLNIRESARRLGVPDTDLRIAQADGISTLANALSDLSDQDSQNTFAHLDPYDPYLKEGNGMNSIELFCALSKRGVKAVLWYGYDSHEYRDGLLAEVKEGLAMEASKQRLWSGDICLAVMNDPNFRFDPGVLGCGILGSHLGEQSISMCEKLGEALASIYSDAVLPEGHSGAIHYGSISI